MTEAEAFPEKKQRRKQREREIWGPRCFFRKESDMVRLEKFRYSKHFHDYFEVLEGDFCKFACMKSTGRANDS